MSQKRLLVVSNRLPFTAVKTQEEVQLRPAAGGLVSAMIPIMKARGGLWFGWGGGITPEKFRDLSFRRMEQAGFSVRFVELSDKEVNRYYYGFSNRTLWPLFHDFVEKAQFRDDQWRAYLSVNRKFAQAVASEIREGDLVWVHDYHLALVPQFLRELVPSARIAFFLHIPFPSPDIFFCLPWREPLLWGMLHSDLVGFHVAPYARNFLKCVEGLFSEAEAMPDGEGLRVQGREVRLGAFPISIDFTRFEEAAASRAVLTRSRRLRGTLGERHLLLGVDRLDYTKGIKERLLAVEKFLEKYPESRRKFVFLQLTVPSRARVKEYGEMKREMEEIVGRINGQFTEEGTIPIHYLYRSVPFSQLVAYYLTADVALVTPLKDGMNLVAKEYVASQVQNRGVLVLSEFTGAALELKEAITVNPYNVDEVADAIQSALTMPEEERAERMMGLRRTVRENDVHHWARSFLAEAP